MTSRSSAPYDGSDVPGLGPGTHAPSLGPFDLDPKPVTSTVNPDALPNAPEDPELPTLWWANDDSWLLALIGGVGSVGALALLAPYYVGAGRITLATTVIALIAGLINILCLWRLNRLATAAAVGDESSPIVAALTAPDRTPRRAVPPVMGRWAAYLMIVSLLLADVAATGSVALVIGQLPSHDGPPGAFQAIDGKLMAVAFVALLPVMRLLGMRMKRVHVVGNFLVMALLLIVVVVALLRLPDAPLPPVPMTVSSLLEPGSMLVFAFAMHLRVGSLLWRPAHASRPATLRISATSTLFIVAIGYLLTVRLLESKSGRPDTLVTAPLLEASQLADDSHVVYRVTIVVLVMMALGVALAWLDDFVHLAGALCRSNGLPDIFTPRRDTSVQPLGEVIAVATIILGVILTTSAPQLVAMAVFGTLLGFLVLNVAAATVSSGWVRVGLFAGAVLCLVYLLALPPGAAIAGTTVIAVALVVRSIYIVWVEPSSPVLVEGLGMRDQYEDDGHSAFESVPRATVTIESTARERAVAPGDRDGE